MITLTHPDDALIAVPHILGYIPERRLVLCGLDTRAKSSDSGARCIGPIVTVEYDSLGLDHATFLADLVARHSVLHAVVVLYCDDLDELDSGELRERLLLVHAVIDAKMDGAGYVFTYASDGRSYERVGERDRTRRAHSLLDESEVAAQFVYEGSAPNRGGPSMELPAVCPADRDRASAAAQSVNDEDAVVALATVLTSEGRHADPETWGAASLALTEVQTRDLVLVYGMRGIVDVDWEHCQRAQILDLLDESITAFPPVDHCTAVVEALEFIAAHEAIGADQALAAAAYLRWWMCRSTLAADRARRALRINDGNVLAQLILDAATAGLTPPWYNAQCRIEDEM